MQVQNLTHLLSNNSITEIEDNTMRLVFVLIGLISVAFAFFALRLLRLEICLLGAGIGFELGITAFSIAFEDPFAGYLALAVSAALAVLGVVLSLKLYKIMVYVSSVLFIYTALYVVLAVALGLIFSSLDMKGIAAFISIALAIPVVAKFNDRFKEIFIVASSLANTIVAALCFSLVIPAEYDYFVWLIVVAAPILAAYSMRFQFKTTEHIVID